MDLKQYLRVLTQIFQGLKESFATDFHIVVHTVSATKVHVLTDASVLQGETDFPAFFRFG